MKYKAKMVYEHTLQSLREAVDLGSPSKALYTIDNESQSINSGNASTTIKEDEKTSIAVSNNYYYLVTPAIRECTKVGPM